MASPDAAQGLPMQMLSSQINLAIVDDDPLFLDYLESRIGREKDIHVLRAVNGDELATLLSQREINCLLLDYDLGAETGLTVVQRLQNQVTEMPPIILATGVGSERTAIKAFRGGFFDYLSKKDLSIAELLRLVRHAVAMRQSERAAMADSLRVQSQLQFDPASGLHSRRHLEECLEELASGRTDEPFAVIALRPRQYAEILRTCGTVVAHDVIREIGERMKDVTRTSDVRGRWEDATFLCIIEQGVTPFYISQLCAALADRLKFEFNSNAWSLGIESEIGAAISTSSRNGGDFVVPEAITAMEQSRVQGTPFMTAFSMVDDARTEPAPPPAEGRRKSDRTGKRAEGALVGRVSDRRGASRHRVLKRGQVAIKTLHSTIDCTIRNLSSAGALIRFEGFFTAPPTFRLIVPGSDINRDVWLRWQVGSDAGVSFMAPDELS